jgi:polysaccharide export outer membrane protein
MKTREVRKIFFICLSVSLGVSLAISANLIFHATEATAAKAAAKDEKPATEKKAGEYHICSGDILDVSVYEEKDLSKSVRVSPDGTIDYPLLGNVHVEGLTARELGEKLRELLEKDYLVNPQVNVFIKEYAKIFVLGQVNRPGAYEMKSGLTVVGAIAMAGGLSESAAANNTTLIRAKGGKKVSMNIPVDSILKGGDTSKDVTLEPGDTINVPESFF